MPQPENDPPDDLRTSEMVVDTLHFESRTTIHLVAVQFDDKNTSEPVLKTGLDELKTNNRVFAALSNVSKTKC